MKLMLKKFGFTLIEILIVIAIISILTAILYSVFFVARKRTKDTVCTSQLRQIGQALKMYATDYDDFPSYGTFFHGALGKLYPTYITNFSILKCPNLPLEESAGPNTTDYGYLYKMNPLPPLPPGETRPKLLTWEEAYEKRGEQLPLVDCRFHGKSLKNEPIGSRHLVTHIILRMDGSVSKSIKGVPTGGNSLHWYDF